jgi:peroxiredoxin
MLSCNNADTVATLKKVDKKTGRSAAVKPETDQHFDINPEELLKDFRTWYNYTYYNVRLAQNFIPLDQDSISIKKRDFLNGLLSGNFFAAKIMEQDNVAVYKLYKLNKVDPDIKSTIQQAATNELEHLNMEGKALPDYRFTDLNGKTYNKANTKGKIVVMKCWFIHCVACVKEFPDLNKLVDAFKDRKDILFVSLAMDKPNELNTFLTQKQFKYAVVANAEEYMRDRLKISEYPTHILTDENGKIIKVTNAISDLIPFLEKQANQMAL